MRFVSETNRKLILILAGLGYLIPFTI